MPKVSIILPTYNRADTLPRALRSVQAQDFQDWELLVVDDGSTDQTPQLLNEWQPIFGARLRVLRQRNQGVTRARNAALAHCQGDYLAFLDSDDEWLPQHLALCVSFLDAHPAAQLVGCALLEDFGRGRQVHHYQVELQEWYPQMARLVGSTRLNLPAGESDFYRRIFSQRLPLGAWSAAFVDVQTAATAHHYVGAVYEHWRWGFLLWLPTTLVRRSVVETVGEFDLTYPICSDYAWLAECCRHFPLHFLSVVTGIKHELAPNGRSLSEGHIAKGRTQHVGAEDLVRYFERNFWRPEEPEAAALLSHKQYYTAQVLLEHGLRERALAYLKAAQPHAPQPWRVFALQCFATLVLSDVLCQQLYATWCRTGYTWALLQHGELEWQELTFKLFAKLADVLPL